MGLLHCFAVFVDKALQNDHTEHAQKATANNKSPQVSPNFFIAEMFLWRLAPMNFIELAVYNKVIHFFKIGDLMQVTMANMSIHTHPSAPTAPY